MTGVATGSPIRVLVVDDSALMRQILKQALADAPDIVVVGVAEDPLAAREQIKALNPDVLTLDVEMPRMDGIAFLEKLMRLRPMPVIMVSTLTEAGAQTTLKALELGAVEFIAKPKGDLRDAIAGLRCELVAKVRAAARARIRPRTGVRVPGSHRLIEGARAAPPRPDAIVAIGASTGGVEALHEIITDLPANAAPVLVVQHMPANFTTSFAARLNSVARVHVSEAVDGERIEAGHVYVAPGSAHLCLARRSGSYACRLDHGALVSGHRPSVDVLFESVAASAGAAAVGVILTGMGRDGASGLLHMRESGAATMGEDESTCVVYGMPRAAKETGGVCAELPRGRIAAEILRRCAEPARRVRA